MSYRSITTGTGNTDPWGVGGHITIWRSDETAPTMVSSTSHIVYTFRRQETDTTATAEFVAELKPLLNTPKRILSRQAHAEMVRGSRARQPPPESAHARHGFQQMARLPCYRGVRTR